MFERFYPRTISIGQRSIFKLSKKALRQLFGYFKLLKQIELGL